MSTRVLIYDTKPYDRQFLESANGAFGFDLTFLEDKLRADTAGIAQSFDAVCAFVNDTLDASVADALHRQGVKLVAMRCAGYNNVDLQSFYGRIHVVRVPAYSPHAVAEHTIALLMALNRKIYRAYQRTRDGNFSLHGLLGKDLYGKKAGIVGTGKIGRIVAQILRGFGMHVLTYDPFPDAVWAGQQSVTYTDLPELLAASDVISLHCPLTPENHHLIDATTLNQMKPGVIILNTGRGGLIDTSALIQALKHSQVGAAGLDVYEEEDRYFFEDFSSEVLQDDVLARLLTFPNVLITAHQAFFTQEALENISNTTLENIRAYIQDGTLTNEVCYRCCEGGCTRPETSRCF